MPGQFVSAMIKVGDTVQFARMPEWVQQLPEESRRVFQFCLGRAYRVVEIDTRGFFILDVGPDVDSRFGDSGNDIRLEAEFLEEMPTPCTELRR